jgi:hypothetical protein
LFEKRPPLRKLVVLADADLLADPDDGTLNPTVLLTGLLTHPYIKLLRYRDAGSPAGTPQKGDTAEGWAELLPPDDYEGRGLVYAHLSEQAVCTRVYGKYAEYARGDESAIAYRDRGVEAAADQRELDTLAAEIAAAVNADLFVTERPYLFEMQWHVAQGVTLCPISKALAVVGLYLRSQNEFVLWHAANGSGKLVTNEWLYYQIGAVELLPELGRWSSAHAALKSEDGRKALSSLHDALLQRVQRSLRTRDAIFRAYNLPQKRDAVRTMLVELDALLMLLMGAVDASARFIHILLSLPTKDRRQAGWQRSAWRDEIAKKATTLGDLFGPSTPLAYTLIILSRLRNTIHSEMIRATVRQSVRSQDAFIRLPDEDEETILEAMDALGGRAAWGARTDHDGSAALDPGLFVERLLPKVLTLLNAVMEHTQDLARERSALFVAGTRARDHLYVSYTGAPSPFLPGELPRSLRGAMRLHGVFVGIDRYSDRLIPDLRCAKADVDRFASLVEETLAPGERTIHRLADEQATRSAILGTIGVEVAATATADDIVVVHFSGHGSPELRGGVDDAARYLVPFDAEYGNLYGSAIDMDRELAGLVRRIRARVVLMSLDACFSGVAGGRTFEGPRLRDARRRRRWAPVLPSLGLGVGRVVMAAADDDEVAIENVALGHGLFSDAMMTVLSDASAQDLSISVTALYDGVAQRVSAATAGAQNPVMNGHTRLARLPRLIPRRGRTGSWNE